MTGIWRSEKVCLLMMQFIGGFLIVSNLSCVAADSIAQEGCPQPSFSVGYRVIDLTCRKDGQKQTLTVAVWYPTAARPKPHNYGGSTSGMIAVDAAPFAAGGPYPMLVFSHGYGGSGLGSVFFTERLAAYGWIVVAPDHHDRYSAVRIRNGQIKDFNRWGLWRHAKEIAASDPDDRDKYLYRLDELKLVIDRMLISDDFHKVIDSSRIAVGGHSFGGYTALGLCGTIEERRDPRIKAVLLFSTGAGGYLFSEEELAGVRIPSMLFMGERERKQKRGSETMSELSAKIYKNVSSPKYFREIEGASHFSFNNRFSDNIGARLTSGTEQQFEVIRRYAIAFLEKHVAGRKGFDYELERCDPLLTSDETSPGFGKPKDIMEEPDISKKERTNRLHSIAGSARSE